MHYLIKDEIGQHVMTSSDNDLKKIKLHAINMLFYYCIRCYGNSAEFGVESMWPPDGDRVHIPWEF